jgi:hypothetical protein
MGTQQKMYEAQHELNRKEWHILLCAAIGLTLPTFPIRSMAGCSSCEQGLPVERCRKIVRLKKSTIPEAIAPVDRGTCRRFRCPDDQRSFLRMLVADRTVGEREGDRKAGSGIAALHLHGPVQLFGQNPHELQTQ